MSKLHAHDDQPIKAARRRREKRLRDEQRGEWDRFEDLTRKLINTPKPKQGKQ